MASKNDPLIESLMQLAASAAPLIRKAREAGIFQTREPVVEAEVVQPVAPEPPVAPAPDISSERASLQDIIVRQALRINELETEVARLQATTPKAAKPRAAKPGAAKPRAAKAGAGKAKSAA